MSITRRVFNKRVLAGIAATATVGTSACDSTSNPAGTGGSGASGGSAGAAGSGGGANTCTLYAEQTAGPFYLDLDTLRQDITEGKSGSRLRLQVQVQNQDCQPLKDLAVDVWHCDAAGIYSGFPGQLGGLDTTGETFLRGTQITDDEGLATFETIYPGWYPGRTTHIHFKVHTSSTMEATSQIYFPEDVTSQIYATTPYDARGPKDTPNDADGIAVARPTPLAEVEPDGSAGHTATILVTVA